MRNSMFRLSGAALLACLVGTAGCQSLGSRFLSVIGVSQKPLTVALVIEPGSPDAAQALNPFQPYGDLRSALSDDLGRPVSLDVCFAFQVQSGLSSGWYDVGVVTPAQYAQLADAEALRVLAVPIDRRGRSARSGLLLVSARSNLQAPGDLRGQRVTFGPRNDARTHLAGLQLLREAGLERTDLALEVVPVPGSLRHLPNARGVLQSVLSGTAAAGFVDELDWDAMAEHDEREGEPARDKARIIGRTVALPTKLLIASVKLEVGDFERVRAALLALADKHTDVLEPLGISGYVVPAEELVAECHNLRVEAPAVKSE